MTKTLFLASQYDSSFSVNLRTYKIYSQETKSVIPNICGKRSAWHEVDLFWSQLRELLIISKKYNSVEEQGKNKSSFGGSFYQKY